MHCFSSGRRRPGPRSEPRLLPLGCRPFAALPALEGAAARSSPTHRSTACLRGKPTRPTSRPPPHRASATKACLRGPTPAAVAPRCSGSTPPPSPPRPSGTSSGCSLKAAAWAPPVSAGLRFTILGCGSSAACPRLADLGGRLRLARTARNRRRRMLDAIERRTKRASPAC